MRKLSHINLILLMHCNENGLLPSLTSNPLPCDKNGGIPDISDSAATGYSRLPFMIIGWSAVLFDFANEQSVT